MSSDANAVEEEANPNAQREQTRSRALTFPAARCPRAVRLAGKAKLCGSIYDKVVVVYVNTTLPVNAEKRWIEPGYNQESDPIVRRPP